MGRRSRRAIGIGGALALLAAAGTAQGLTERVSVSSLGVEGNAPSRLPALSGDGHFAVFESASTGLVPGDTNGKDDVFVFDRLLRTLERVSLHTDGTQGDGHSRLPDVSDDGRWVVFESNAGTLVDGDTNAKRDVFAHDRSTGETRRVSVGPARLEADGHSFGARLSGDGRFVAFHSLAANLVPGDGNGTFDVFVHELASGLTERVSVDSAGLEGDGPSQFPSLSEDGRFVAFESLAANLVPGDTNLRWDVFVHDRQSGQTRRVSVDSSGVQGNDVSSLASISADGTRIAFWSDATNFYADLNVSADIFLHDTTTAVTELISQDDLGTPSNNLSFDPSISADGRFVAFNSFATNLVPADTNLVRDVFVRDTLAGTTVRASVDSNGNEADFHSWFQAIAADGSAVVFASDARNLVTGDGNLVQDVFVHELALRTPWVYCEAKPSSQGCLPAMEFKGAPSATSSARFNVVARSVLNEKNGILFYGSAPNAAPFLGGVLCVSSPLRRTPLQNSGGNFGPDDCSGSLSFDFNAHARSGRDPALVPGTDVFAQYWYRDPPDGQHVGLTDGLTFVIGP